jgi:hypothetical protein
MEAQKWFAVQCFFVIEAGGITSDRGQMYEERITIWRAESPEEALEKGLEEADRYATDTRFAIERIHYARSVEMFDPPGEGTEVWSVMRDSWLPPKEYVERYVIEGDPHASPFEGEDE